jgi:hypothetical protein
MWPNANPNLLDVSSTPNRLLTSNLKAQVGGSAGVYTLAHNACRSSFVHTAAAGLQNEKCDSNCTAAQQQPVMCALA